MTTTTRDPSTVPIRIVVDHREEPSGLPAALRRCWPSVDESMLDVGDVAVGPRVLLERKTLQDLVASMADGRLFHQAYRLSYAAVRPALLLEGMGDLAAMGLAPAAIRGLKLSLALGYRLPVLRTADLEASARLMADIAWRETTWWKRRQSHAENARFGPSLDTLMSIAGVGLLRAKRLLLAFGSVAALARASAKDLRRVAGIGPTTAFRILDVLHASPAPVRPSVVSAPPPPLPPSSGLGPPEVPPPDR